jgi:hypothetical protein
MDSGIPQTKKVKDLSHLSLKSNVYQRPVLIVNGFRRVSLNPKAFTQGKWVANCE